MVDVLRAGWWGRGGAARAVAAVAAARGRVLVLERERGAAAGEMQAPPTVDEYDVLVYPGFMRRAPARWNEDGSAAPASRLRGGKGEPFTLQLTKDEIVDDLNAIDHAVREAASQRSKAAAK